MKTSKRDFRPSLGPLCHWPWIILSAIIIILLTGPAAARPATNCLAETGRPVVDASDIRTALDVGATLLISKGGGRILCESPRGRVEMQPVRLIPFDPPSVAIEFAPQSAAIPHEAEPAIRNFLESTRNQWSSFRIIAIAISTHDPARAARLAHARATALRNFVQASTLGGIDLETQALGRRHGKEEVRLLGVTGKFARSTNALRQDGVFSRKRAQGRSTGLLL